MAAVQVDCDPTSGLQKQINAHGERRKLKSLMGVITGPTIRLNGSRLTTLGYDPTTHLFFAPMGEVVPDVPMHPTLEQTRGALTMLMQTFQTFPFVDATAKGTLLAAILTAVIRPVLPTAQTFAFDAPIQGSGKTLLASCIGALVEGCAPDVWPHTQGRDDEEARKKLFTALRTGCRALVWDNVTGTFDSASMAAFITADAMVDRILGKPESTRMPSRALLILTGNRLNGLNLCNVDMKEADGAALELLTLWLDTFHIRQPRDATTLKAPMQRRTRQIRDRWLKSIKTIVQRQQCMPP